MDNNPLLFDIEKILQLVPVTKSHLYKQMREGTFPRPIKMGSRSLWKPEEVESWIDAQKSKSE